MSRKTFVLDTNVLLHDPDSINKFHNSNVVMPLAVLEELDKQKRFTSELGKNARDVIRFIDEFPGNLLQGVALENGVQFSIFVDPSPVDKKKFPLPLDNTKHRILFTAFMLQKQGLDVVVLISKDIVLRIKAESIGLIAEDYESLKESYETLYTGFKRVRVPKREIDEFCKEGFYDLKKQKLCPNEYRLLTCPENSTMMGKYNMENNRLEPLLPLGRGVWGIKPLNDEQKCAMDLLLRDDIKLVTLIGKAGTGKTLLALTCGLLKVFDEDVYKKILISRPIMPLGKDIGYLPGTKEEKILHWMQPIYDNLEYLCEFTAGAQNGAETKNWIINSGKIEMEAVTYIRGRSLAKTYIIIDEAQNLSPHEIKTIISRAGKGTKVILTGDPTQIDNPYLDKDSNALTFVVERFKNSKLYGNIVFEKTERSKLAALAAELL